MRYLIVFFAAVYGGTTIQSHVGIKANGFPIYDQFTGACSSKYFETYKRKPSGVAVTGFSEVSEQDYNKFLDTGK